MGAGDLGFAIGGRRQRFVTVETPGPRCRATRPPHPDPPLPRGWLLEAAGGDRPRQGRLRATLMAAGS